MGVYAPIDYVIYLGILLVILYVLKKLLWERIEIDEKFLYLILPYIPLGVFIRVLADAGAIEKSKLWSITPGVYVFTIAIALAGVGIGYLLKKQTGIGYWVVPAAIGTAGTIYTGYLLTGYVKNPAILLEPVGLAALITLVFSAPVLLGKKIQHYPFDSKINASILFAHMLDASSTFLAHDFHGFGEEHILPRLLIDLVGGTAFVMIPVKLVIVALLLVALEQYKLEEDYNPMLYKILKILVFVLGLGPGMRNTLLLSLV